MNITLEERQQLLEILNTEDETRAQLSLHLHSNKKKHAIAPATDFDNGSKLRTVFVVIEGPDSNKTYQKYASAIAANNIGEIPINKVRASLRENKSFKHNEVVYQCYYRSTLPEGMYEMQFITIDTQN